MHRSVDRLALPALLALALLPAGCGLLKTAAKAPATVTRAVIPGEKPPELTDPAEQQSEVMRLAEAALLETDAATRVFADAKGTEEARLQAAMWRVRAFQQALSIGTRPDSIAAVLDMIVATKLAGVALQDELIPGAWGEQARSLLTCYRSLEEQAWTLAARMIKTRQLDEVRAVVDQWAADLGKVSGTGLQQPPSISDILRKGKGSGGGGLADLFSLDPFSGLEPTTRELAQARLFAERSLFFAKHLPALTRAQLELATLQLRRQPETVQLLDDVARVAKAAEGFGGVAEDLPAVIAGEREAAIRQVFEELELQRQGLLADLERAQPPVDELLQSSRATLEAAERTSAGLTALVEAVGVFLDRFEPPEGAPPEPEPEGPPARPFDITEYGDAVTRLGETARELTTLVTELERSLPEVERLVDVAAERGEQGIDLAFRRGLQLGLLLIGAAALAVLVVRRVSRGAGRG